MSGVSIIVLTRDNERIIGDLLKSAHWAEEIVIVDSGSTDSTRQAALSAHPRVRFMERALDSFAEQRNFGIDNATQDWVFHCDSDERFTEKLSAEVRQCIVNSPKGTAWNVVERFYWRGRRTSFIDGPWGGMVKLHRRGEARFTGKIHEQIVFNGPIRLLGEPIEHHTEMTLDELVCKYQAYSSREAEAGLAGERALDRSALALLYRPAKRLFGFVLIKGAYRDGLPGLLWACLQAFSVFLTYAKFQACRSGLGALVRRDNGK